VLRTLREITEPFITVFGCAATATAQSVRSWPLPPRNSPTGQFLHRTTPHRGPCPNTLRNASRLRTNRYEEIPDRTEAIRKAVTLALPGDIVLIAGKGHETYQEFADGKIPFDDSAVARRAIEEKRVEIEEDDDSGDRPPSNRRRET
jgi:UDP-N-acetylmuramoyl-L-alanyl-D-glutamate--2,6-diaminopimelate ligase